MKLDAKINFLPLTRNNPSALNSLFGSTDILPLWVADMEFEIAEPIQKALTERILNSGFAYEYKPESFYQTQKKWYQKRYGIALVKEDVLYTPSITTTITIALEELTAVGDGVIIQPPVFMEFRDVIRKTNRKIVKNPLKLVNHKYEIDFDDLEQKASVKTTTALIICNPHNPVGRVWTKLELERIVSICKKNDVLLIVDEIHKDIILFDNQFFSALHFNRMYDKLIVCTSEAKTFNLCGIADSFAIIGDEHIRNTIATTLKKYNLGRTNALTRVALEAAYNEGEEWLNNVISTVESNVLLIEQALENSPIKLIKPEGTYQVWLDFSAVFNDTKEMFTVITEKSNVGLNAGHWFGKEGALFMRMNIATSHEKIKKAIQQIVAAVA